jgi:hypothetical protein
MLPRRLFDIEHMPPRVESPWRVEMMNYRTILAAPGICALLLIGMVAESSSRVTPTDAEPYHRRAKSAVESIPTQIGSWRGRKETIPREAMQILRPNAIRCWKYVDSDTTNPRCYDRWAVLLVDQCREARDMSGHFPPNCYRNSGQELIYQAPRDWVVNGMTIPGMEYHFRQNTGTQSTSTAVYDFLIVPNVPGVSGSQIYRDISGVDRAAEDYQRRFFGAAQFQLVMDADLSQSERDGIFAALMAPCVPVIKTLMSGEMK